jgi:hypothetical protein
MAQSGALKPAQAAPRKPFPTLPEPLLLARFPVTEDLRGAIGAWLDWLAAERRASRRSSIFSASISARSQASLACRG